MHACTCFIASSNASLVLRACVPSDRTFQGLTWWTCVKEIQHTSTVDMCCFRLALFIERTHGGGINWTKKEPLRLNLSKKHNYILQDQLYSLLPRYQPSTLPWLSAFVHSYYKINSCMKSVVCVTVKCISKSTINNSSWPLCTIECGCILRNLELLHPGQ